MIGPNTDKRVVQLDENEHNQIPQGLKHSVSRKSCSRIHFWPPTLDVCQGRKIEFFNFFSTRQISMKICMRCCFYICFAMFALSRLHEPHFYVFCHHDPKKVPKGGQVLSFPVVRWKNMITMRKSIKNYGDPESGWILEPTLNRRKIGPKGPRPYRVEDPPVCQCCPPEQIPKESASHHVK